MIKSISESKPVLNVKYNNINSINFSGLKTPDAKCMFVFDLDGTFAHSTNEEIQKIIQIRKQQNATLIYATGRSKKQFEELQKESESKGIFLPTPEYLISNNGQFLHENIDGFLVENLEYKSILKTKTNFDSKTVFNTMKKLANSDKYKFNPQELSRLEKLENFKDIKASDPDFYESKISYYEWNASEFMSEYFIASDVDIEKLKKDIQSELDDYGIKTKFIENLYSKKTMDDCRDDILLQSNPLRRHNDGAMTAFFLCPADKSDGIEFLKNKLDVPYNEVLMAGNDDNDIPMADLSKKGAYFICLNNSSDKLKEAVNKLKAVFNSIFITKNDGANGILDGMSEIIK